jgi:hypothetical protein
VHTLCVVPSGGDAGGAGAGSKRSQPPPQLWACAGNGNVAIFSLQDNTLTNKVNGGSAAAHAAAVTCRRPQQSPTAWWCVVLGLRTHPSLQALVAHTGEVLAAVPAPGGGFVATAGADFQVKTWTPAGELLSASGHHHSAVQALAIMPLAPSHPAQQQHTPPSSARRPSAAHRRRSTATHTTSSAAGSGAGACKVWAGGSDGSLSVCTDAAGRGCLDPADWRLLKVDGMAGACACARAYVQAPLGAGVRLSQMHTVCAARWPVVPAAAVRGAVHRHVHVAAGVRCMLLLPGTSRLWVGCDDGRVWVLDGAAETLLATFRPLGGGAPPPSSSLPSSSSSSAAAAAAAAAAGAAITAMAAVGRADGPGGLASGSSSSSNGPGEVWVAAERALMVLDPGTGAPRYSLPLLEGSAGGIKVRACGCRVGCVQKGAGHQHSHPAARTHAHTRRHRRCCRGAGACG